MSILINSLRIMRLTIIKRSIQPFPKRSYSTPPPHSSTSTNQIKSKKPSSATSLFYKNMIPSMLHCLALGSIIYYGLELLHNTLDSELIQEELGIRIEDLEMELEVVRNGGGGAVGGGGIGGVGGNKSWWKVW